MDLDGGWAVVDGILKELKLSREELDRIVEEDAKGRYSYDETGNRIRANQGHSIPGVVIEMERSEPPEFLYHGTATRFLDDIMRDGLKPMGRQWIHISPDYETAVAVGKRHGEPIVLKIRAREFAADGNELLRAANGVWQTKFVHPKYFEIYSASG